MKVRNFLIFLSVLFFCFISGCLNEDLRTEEQHPVITNVDVMATPADEEFQLRVTAYIQNPANSDTGSLSVRVKTKDPYTNLITAEYSESVGYLKATSQTYKAFNFNVPNSGDQLVQVELFEDTNLVDDHTTQIELVQGTDDVVANVILTDLMIETIQATNYGEDIIFEASPGLYNQGDEVNKVTVVVTATVDEYTRYTGSVIVSNLEANQRKRGTVRMTVPADESYSFEVDVIVDGEVTSSAATSMSIKLHDLKLETPVTYPLLGSEAPVEEEMPEEEVEDTAAEESPGFGIPVLVISMLFAAGTIRKKNRKV
ncbi:hypothetical protein [Methanolobus sp. WCC4]|uniref:DUF7490 domain-containing protein n=1 Tax=Methanolobus sp. WCC4 TaxID=3125784 RepID=UPI0030F5C258